MDFQLSWLGIFAANVSQPQAQGYDSPMLYVYSQCRQWFLWGHVEHIAFDVSITGSGSKLHARHPPSAVPVN